MLLDRLQLAAMVKAGKDMALADGKIVPEELNVIAMGIGEFGDQSDDTQLLLSSAEAMEPGEMLSILSSMNDEQKKLVCGYLATIITSDGNIDDGEMKLWQSISSLLNLPNMKIEEASEFWRTNH